MDEEEQQEEQQQEQPIASSAFTNLSINPAPRRPISTFSLFNRQSRERDESISGAVRKNASAINTINTSLVNITGQVVILSKSLNQVAQKLQETSTLERMKADQERKQAAMLADRNTRRGVENNIEKGIQNALFAPVRRIGAKTRFTLGRLVQFFNTILGGFLVMRAIKLIDALATGNKDQLQNIKDNIVKQLGAVAGIFLAINGGIVLALRSITRLASFLTQVAVTNLLVRPIQLIFKVAKNLAKAIALGAGAGAAGGLPPAPPNVNTNTKNQNNKNKTSGVKTSAMISLGLTVADAFGGTPVDEAVAGGVGSFGTFLLLNRIGSVLSRTPNPFARGLGYTLQFGSPILGEIFGRPGGKQGYGLIQQALGLESVTTDQRGNIFSTTLDKVNRNNVSVTTTPIPNEKPMSAEGRAALLMFAPPANPNNPYVYNSYIQYNVIPV